MAPSTSFPSMHLEHTWAGRRISVVPVISFWVYVFCPALLVCLILEHDLEHVSHFIRRRMPGSHKVQPNSKKSSSCLFNVPISPHHKLSGHLKQFSYIIRIYLIFS
jgi:hypothetical protein